jgi:hypothetical protein
MANKKNVQSMTPEELATYVETVRQRNAANSKKYYEQKIKNDPEKYAKFLDKCRAPNRKYYHSKQMRIEDELTNPAALQEQLAQYF